MNEHPSGSRILISRELAERCAEALLYVAHNEAGMSQAPDLFGPEDTQEWDDAQTILQKLKN